MSSLLEILHTLLWGFWEACSPVVQLIMRVAWIIVMIFLCAVVISLISQAIMFIIIVIIFAIGIYKAVRIFI